ncbi:MAG: CHASE2 domain-containing protein, partial [Gammaproteobacteria bacterium]|nr:CHASE2 domain-containing protein [Gammaproteobacteria bacterium]
MAAALIGLVALLTYTDSLWNWDQLIYDWQIRTWSRAPDDAITIVAIDERSLSELGRWPWSRAVHAELVERLAGAGVRAVGLDVVFAEPNADEPEGDNRLVQAVSDLGRVVLPVVNEERRLGGQLVELLPIPALAEAAAQLGHVDRQLDADAITRSAYLKAGLGTPHWPSFALAMLMVHQPKQWVAIPGLRHRSSGDRFPPAWTRDHQIWIPYAGPPGRIPRVSFVDVLRGGVPLENFKNKFVLVGATAAGMGDLLPTPVSGDRNPMPGVEVVANELDTLIQNLSVLPVPFGWRVLVTSLLVLAPLLLYSRYPRWSLAVGVGFGIVVLVFSVMLLRLAHYWFAPATALVTLFATYAVWSWRRLVQSVRYFNQALRRLSNEPAGVHWTQAPELGEAMEFLSGLLPVTGCAVLDDRGNVKGSWGKLPAVASHRPELGAWLIELPALWMSISRTGPPWQLGFTWNDDRPPDTAALRLLSNAGIPFAGGGERSPRTPVEAMQARIQQVQAATDRLQVMRRFITDTLAHMAHGVVVANGLGRVLMANSRAAGYLGESDANGLTDAPFARLLQKLDIQSGEDPMDLLRAVLLDGETVEAAARTLSGQDV